MKATSALYKELRTQTGTYYEVRVIRGSKIYGMDTLKTVKIKQALFEKTGPQIGGVYSAQCEMKLIEQSSLWPRGASFRVEIRLTNGTQYDDWMNLGTFYTDERHADKYGNLSIASFDGMLMMEQTWTDKVEELPPAWPITSKKAAELIVEATGIQISNIQSLDDTKAYIGLDTTSTARDVLSAIATGNGGNFMMLSDGTLKLVVLKNYTPGSAAIAGISITGDGEINIGNTSVAMADVGKAVKDITVSAPLPPISGVEIKSISTDALAFAGTRDGYVIKATSDFSDTDIAIACLQNINGYVYTPFDAIAARIDPAAEIGDLVMIDGEVYPIVFLNWNISPKITADISAPFEEEVDHEYTIESESAKTLRKAISATNELNAELRSYIIQTATQILQSVESTYVDNSELVEELANYSTTDAIASSYYNKMESDTQAQALRGQIELTDSSLTTSFTELRKDTNNALNAMSYYIRYENGVVIIGRTDRPTSVHITDEAIEMYYGNERVTYWNQNKQYTPKELEIPSGGKFTLGSVLWQPRSSGHLSLFWVGA